MNSMDEFQGWFYKKASTSLAGWQSRFLKLKDKKLFYSKREMLEGKEQDGIHEIELSEIVSLEELRNSKHEDVVLKIGVKENV